MCSTGTPVRAPICIRQPMLPATITSGRVASSVATLRAPELPRDLGLEEVVGPRRAAAEMRVARLAPRRTPPAAAAQTGSALTRCPCWSEQAEW